jgi:hypothetical protein
MPDIGAGELGKVAREQLEDHRNDPRLGEDVALLKSFTLSVEEAERSRFLAILGIEELQEIVKQTEAALGVSKDDPNITNEQQAELQARWEQQEFARVEREADYPYFNAMGLAATYGALDALIEDMIPSYFEYVASTQLRTLLEQAGPAEDSAAIERLHSAIMRSADVRKELDKAEKKIGRVAGGGAERYERHLSAMGLSAPPGRELPKELDETLAEAGALRNVILHRGGRVDELARRKAPTLKYDVGAFVRLTTAEYRRYSAAIRTFADEVWDRMCLRAGIDAPNELGAWERNHSLWV